MIRLSLLLIRLVNFLPNPQILSGEMAELAAKRLNVSNLIERMHIPEIEPSHLFLAAVAIVHLVSTAIRLYSEP